MPCPSTPPLHTVLPTPLIAFPFCSSDYHPQTITGIITTTVSHFRTGPDICSWKCERETILDPHPIANLDHVHPPCHPPKQNLHCHPYQLLCKAHDFTGQIWSSSMPTTESKGNQKPRIKTRYRKLSYTCTRNMTEHTWLIRNTWEACEFFTCIYGNAFWWQHLIWLVLSGTQSKKGGDGVSIQHALTKALYFEVLALDPTWLNVVVNLIVSQWSLY